MATESIVFPEDQIPGVIRIIRKGLKGERNKELREQLHLQCDELEEYYSNTLQDDE